MTVSRRALFVGVGAVAAAAGLGWSLRPKAPPPEATMWTMEFDTPTGARLPMAGLRGRPLVLNFWASWCLPCLKEMPQLDRFHAERAAQGWQVLGLAVDRAEPVRAFLEKRPVRFPVALAGVEGMDLGLHLGNRNGALPFTVIFDAAGRVARTKLGETNFAELSGWAAELGA